MLRRDARWGALVACLAGCQALAPGGLPPDAAGAMAAVPIPAPAAPAEAAPTSPTAWVVYGDSLTHQAFMSLAGWPEAFAPAAAPDVVNAGLPGATSRTAVLVLDEVLAANPGPRRMGLAFGTNDVRASLGPPSAFGERLRQLVRRVEAAGKRPLLARIPWSGQPAYAQVPAFNAALDAAAAAEGLGPGPDFYAWFKDHPDQLGADGVHLTAAGEAAMRRLWAERLRAD